jgi:hypothetical protein
MHQNEKIPDRKPYHPYDLRSSYQKIKNDENSSLFMNSCAALDYSQLPEHQNSLMAARAIPFLPVAWDRPAAAEPGSETVERAALYSANICRQLWVT